MSLPSEDLDTGHAVGADDSVFDIRLTASTEDSRGYQRASEIQPQGGSTTSLGEVVPVVDRLVSVVRKPDRIARR